MRNMPEEIWELATHHKEILEDLKTLNYADPRFTDDVISNLLEVMG